MKQLKMVCMQRPTEAKTLPEGYTVCRYSDVKERMEWVNICKNGLIADDADTSKFDGELTLYRDCDPNRDTFFIKHGDEYVGTITAIMHPHGHGYVHMVSIRTDYRGKGISSYMNWLAVDDLFKRGAKYITLTTNDWRVPAVKGYLAVGFQPMLFGGLHTIPSTIKRWEKIYKDFGKDELTIYSWFRTVFYKTKIN